MGQHGSVSLSGRRVPCRSLYGIASERLDVPAIAQQRGGRLATHTPGRTEHKRGPLASAVRVFIDRVVARRCDRPRQRNRGLARCRVNRGCAVAGEIYWPGLVLPMIDNSIAAARVSGARILFSGTIYNYGPDAFPVLTEELSPASSTRKGAIRVALAATTKGGKPGRRPHYCAAGGYFFGPRPCNNWFSQALVKPGRPVHTITYPGTPGVGHAWAYLPDVAEAFALLAEREAASIRGLRHVPFRGPLVSRRHSHAHRNCPSCRQTRSQVKPLPWGFLRLVAPYNETVRELLEMRPLWREPVPAQSPKVACHPGS